MPFENIQKDVKSVAAFLRGFSTIFAICISWTAVVFLDVWVLGTCCLENSPVEWLQFSLVAASSAAMAARAWRVEKGRAAFILTAAFFLDMAIREQDALLDNLMWHGGWAWVVGAVTMTAFALALRWRATLHDGLEEIQRSNRFLMLATGLAVILAISRIMGMKRLWAGFGCTSGIYLAKRVIEEGLELFGYMLIFAWAAPYLPLPRLVDESSDSSRSHRSRIASRE